MHVFLVIPKFISAPHPTTILSIGRLNLLGNFSWCPNRYYEYILDYVMRFWWLWYCGAPVLRALCAVWIIVLWFYLYFWTLSALLTPQVYMQFHCRPNFFYLPTSCRRHYWVALIVLCLLEVSYHGLRVGFPILLPLPPFLLGSNLWSQISFDSMEEKILNISNIRHYY